jgi:predicted NBD/HSP70 family sugar kinase
MQTVPGALGSQLSPNDGRCPIASSVRTVTAQSPELKAASNAAVGAENALRRTNSTEGSMAESTGGRRSRRLEFRADRGLLLVAELGATAINAAVTDLAGHILDRRHEDIDIAAGPEIVLSTLEGIFDSLVSDRAGQAVWGIGIGLPGPVEFSNGSPTSPPIMPGWDRYPVRVRMPARFDAPTWIDNDVNMLALGELRRGLAIGVDDAVFVKIGTGIGAGLISDGHLHRGAQGAAGDIGHVQVVDDNAHLCRCGKVGCLEAVAGGHALARQG